MQYDKRKLQKITLILWNGNQTRTDPKNNYENT